MTTDASHAHHDHQPKHPGATASLTWLPKKTFSLEITIPWQAVATTYQKVLNQATEHVSLKGFRKGKAPKEMVEKEVGKTQLFENVIKELVPQVYADMVAQHHLHPIIAPEIQPVRMQEDTDWVMKATSCELPEVTLGNYQDAIKTAKAKDAIWTPEKEAQQQTKDKDQEESQKLEHILDVLMTTAKAEISDMMLEKETNRMLSKLLDQTNSLGMTIDQYLQTKNMTKDQLRNEYQSIAERDLKLEFVLLKVSEDAKMSVATEELQAFTDKVATDEATRQSLQTSEQQAYLYHLLRKQKTIEYLKSL